MVYIIYIIISDYAPTPFAGGQVMDRYDIGNIVLDILLLAIMIPVVYFGYWAFANDPALHLNSVLPEREFGISFAAVIVFVLFWMVSGWRQVDDYDKVHWSWVFGIGYCLWGPFALFVKTVDRVCRCRY